MRFDVSPTLLAERRQNLPSPFGRGAGGEGLHGAEQLALALTLTLSQRERGLFTS